MAYSLHIERPGSSISLEEWLTAASPIESLRPRASGYTAVNPKTGATIQIGESSGDLEIALPQSFVARILGKAKDWEPAFFFSQGRATFRAPDDMDSPEDALRIAAAALARSLGASIVGDNGETYQW